MSDQPFPRRVPVGALLARPTDPPQPADPAQLEAARRAGQAEAMAEARAREEALQAKLEEALAKARAHEQEAARLTARLAAELETIFTREIASVAHAAAEAVLAAQPTWAQSTISSLVAEAVGGLPRGTLWVNEEQLGLARSLAPDGWQIAARPGLGLGEVEAEAGPALQRASISNRLDQLLGRDPC
jgi:flagellar biosynthesis/type III secretory pathway protein FliH